MRGKPAQDPHDANAHGPAHPGQGAETPGPGNGPERHRERDEQARRNRETWRRYAQDERHSWTPWLLTRYQLNDVGARPIPNGVPYYYSPDIWIESSDPLGNPVAGEPNFVHVNIFNLGKA